MKTKAKTQTQPDAGCDLNEDDIRSYAYHLYEQGGCSPGHDLDNWLEAKACLEANVPRAHTRTRLHRQRHPEASKSLVVVDLHRDVEPLLEPMRP